MGEVDELSPHCTTLQESTLSDLGVVTASRHTEQAAISRPSSQMSDPVPSQKPEPRPRYKRREELSPDQLEQLGIGVGDVVSARADDDGEPVPSLTFLELWLPASRHSLLNRRMERVGRA